MPFPSEPAPLAESLREIVKGAVCIMGVGNRMRGDDGAGPVLMDALAGRVDAHCIDAGTAPENVVEKTARLGPDTVLIVDALHFDAQPGDCRVFVPEDLPAGGISTHAPSLQLTCEYLRARIPVSVFVIGIQPQAIRLGDSLSSAVGRAVHELAGLLVELLGSHTPPP
ncbi:hydrogenase 3 maturation endopeptidase HyCI [Verrucomicrobiota bacterium]